MIAPVGLVAGGGLTRRPVPPLRRSFPVLKNVRLQYRLGLTDRIGHPMNPRQLVEMETRHGRLLHAASAHPVFRLPLFCFFVLSVVIDADLI